MFSKWKRNSILWHKIKALLSTLNEKYINILRMKKLVPKNPKFKRKILKPEHALCFWWVPLKPGLTTWYFLDIFFVTPTNYGHKFFVCLATVFGKPTDQHLLSRCACEIDIWKNTVFSCNLFWLGNFLETSKYKKETFTFESKVS